MSRGGVYAAVVLGLAAAWSHGLIAVMTTDRPELHALSTAAGVAAVYALAVAVLAPLFAVRWTR